MARKQFSNTERLMKKTHMKVSTSHGRITFICLDLKFYVFIVKSQIKKFLNKKQEMKFQTKYMRQEVLKLKKSSNLNE